MRRNAAAYPARFTAKREILLANQRVDAPKRIGKSKDLPKILRVSSVVEKGIRLRILRQMQEIIIEKVDNKPSVPFCLADDPERHLLAAAHADKHVRPADILRADVSCLTEADDRRRLLQGMKRVQNADFYRRDFFRAFHQNVRSSFLHLVNSISQKYTEFSPPPFPLPSAGIRECCKHTQDAV